MGILEEHGRNVHFCVVAPRVEAQALHTGLAKKLEQLSSHACPFWHPQVIGHVLPLDKNASIWRIVSKLKRLVAFAVAVKLEMGFSNRQNEHFWDVGRVVRMDQNARCSSFV